MPHKMIRCPYCQSSYGPGSGYFHDEKLNIRCSKCKKIIFGTTEEDEAELWAFYHRTVREHHQTNERIDPMAQAAISQQYHPNHHRSGRSGIPIEAGGDFGDTGYD